MMLLLTGDLGVTHWIKPLTGVNQGEESDVGNGASDVHTDPLDYWLMELRTN
jgi:hypothetical protein